MELTIRFIKKLILILTDFVFFWTHFVPLKNWIIFESNPDFNDESFWFCKKLIDNNYHTKYRLYWIIRNNNPNYTPSDWDIKTIQLSPDSIFHFLQQQYVLRRAKYIFESCYFLNKYDKRQYLINLYHGMQMKNIKTVISHMIDYDYFANGTHYTDEYYTNEVGLSQEKLLHYGMIRNDELKKTTNYLSQMGLKSDSISKVVLWMPTYRQHVVGETTMTLPKMPGLGLPFIYDEESLMKLNSNLKEYKVLLLVKAHQSQVLDNIQIGNLSNIKLITTEQLQSHNIQLYSIIGETDSLITDYSSVYYDYLLLDKPIGLACDDLQQYEHKIGFVFSHYNPSGYEENVKGIHIRSLSDLISFCIFYTKEDWTNDFNVNELKHHYHDVTDFSSGEKYLRFCIDRLGM